MRFGLIFVIISFCFSWVGCAQVKKISSFNNEVKTGADQINEYLPLLKGKSIAVFANQTSVVNHTHLVDTLTKLGIRIVKIFGPEHGFRGNADAGEHVNNGIDAQTGIPIVSLYGSHKKPTPNDLADIDILLFDIQDVGVRFYTFISSLQYCMEACMENNKQLILLDRPNPNGFYVDGPVLDTNFRSFVGMQPIPIVYGMTIGEYALMLYGENWLSVNTDNKNLQKNWLKVIPCKNYDHNCLYSLPVNPSPNLKQMQSVYWYPSICFFEGTLISEGRGTPSPFQVFGHPSLPEDLYTFTPMPNQGAKSSKCFYQKCYGWNLTGTKDEVLEKTEKKLQIKYLLQAYQLFPGKDSFFLKNNFFNSLAGNNQLMKQIRQGVGENAIRKSWEPELTKFKAIRKKYLLYRDFEN
jgi:hypothetical protein